ncbi:MAG: transcription-repair coupling factor [Bacteroidales bacterium]|jgi:transcription-repair coupling factor (superfamily II helicase)|nr:transcription-repair coupling factor [Bacteroidales bacterium]
MKQLLEKLFQNNLPYKNLLNQVNDKEKQQIGLKGLIGSSKAFVVASLFSKCFDNQCIVLEDKEAASYFFDDINNILGENENILFLPSIYKQSSEYLKSDSTNIILKTECLNKIYNSKKKLLIITYPEAISEKTVTSKQLINSILEIDVGAELSMNFIIDILNENGFQADHFVYEPGVFSVRGSIIDVFSYGDEQPYRIDFFGDIVESIRTFDVETQLSIKKIKKIKIVPNIHENIEEKDKSSFFESLNDNWNFWIEYPEAIIAQVDKIYNFEKEKLEEIRKKNQEPGSKNLDGRRGEEAKSLISYYSLLTTHDFNHIPKNQFIKEIQNHRIIEFAGNFVFCKEDIIQFTTSAQPNFKKNFDLIIEDLENNQLKDYQTFILSNNEKQIERIKEVFEEKNADIEFIPILETINKGFVFVDSKICVYTDHEIFDRYHRYVTKNFSRKESLSLQDLKGLQPGDYVVHVDNGIGKFGGLQTIDNNGKKQEVISIIYGNGDILYVSIHSSHKISKYRDRDGEPPKIYPLGSGMWKRLKERTKKNIKDIAKDLILLYAKRKEIKGFAFSPDTYLQYELESSFIYEDTPDQIKTNEAIKKDMESDTPMDRLICGDVGFGKTELAIRAAFKAACDSKQIAVLVPTTILALQHFQTFSERLKDLPVSVAYISRLKSNAEIKATLEKVKEGKIDILIGTHRIVGKDVVFKDLGLLIIDEEQKFGVSIKEKIKQMKTNIDTLTLSATPIPRTLQFSLMGARDMSIISMPPPNRQPVETELHVFDTEIIKKAINYEVGRNGQVFFINNRIQNIYEVEKMINKICPKVKIVVAHGQMEGSKLEKIIMNFIRGDFDVLISTSIIENGVDISNVNTIIINEANRFGLSDLHQLRGRVGRNNKKAFCYLLSAPIEELTPEARRRLRAIEEFSELGSGLNIAVQDLDIRGAGNILGSEQSGFIADIGYETFLKILNEALEELRLSDDFKDAFPSQENNLPTSSIDCIIETDFEVLIPDYYITNSTERIKIYKELDAITNENDLEIYKLNLEDRFGKIPEGTNNLFKVVELRQIAQKFCFSKIIIKNNIFIGYFPKNQKSPFYFSDNFTAIINYIQEHQKQCEIKMKNEELTLRISNVYSLEILIRIFEEIK